MTQTAEVTGPAPRLRTLDGMRGIAALVVLFHHSLLMLPTLASPYYQGGPISSPARCEWWLIHTPLHALWDGQGAVYIFFVLSGIVLALPVLRAVNSGHPGTSYSWRAFYPQRLIRLYVPVWAAVMFAVATFFIVPRVGEAASDWIRERPTEVSLIAFLKDMTLVLGNGGLASPLWSLRFEILFSLALPVYIWLARKRTGLLVPKLVASLLVVSLGGYLDNTSLLYFPMFMVGVLAAEELPRLRKIAENIEAMRRPTLVWWAFLGTGLVLLNTRWFVLLAAPPPNLANLTSGMMLTGASFIVFVSIGCPPARRILESRAVQWLGTISFSLYLIHEPIVVASGYFFGPDRIPIAIVVAVSLSLMLAPFFYKYVENPSHRLAKRVRQRATSKSTERAGITL